jgi:hypothetical protein
MRGDSDFVEHPRFGSAPRLTGLDVSDSPDGTVYCHWHSPPGVRIPNTAIAADVTRQRRATLHVTHYFDARRVCRSCGRPFLFFAEEQKHWYEELGFPLEADCLECPPCRKDEQRLQAHRRRYEVLLAKPDRTRDDTLELVESGIVLVESAVFSAQLLPKLRGLLASRSDSERARELSTRITRAATSAAPTSRAERAPRRAPRRSP